MRTYELILIIRPVADAERKKVLEAVKEALGSVNFVKETDWGSKLLKYAIKKEMTGNYYDMVFEAENLPADFTKKLLRMGNVMRHLVIRQK